MSVWPPNNPTRYPRGNTAPKPDNFEAMCAAWNDPAAFRAEVGKYEQQLRAAGYTAYPRAHTSNVVPVDFTAPRRNNDDARDRRTS